MSGEMKYRYMS